MVLVIILPSIEIGKNLYVPYVQVIVSYQTDLRFEKNCFKKTFNMLNHLGTLSTINKIQQNVSHIPNELLHGMIPTRI